MPTQKRVIQLPTLKHLQDAEARLQAQGYTKVDPDQPLGPKNYCVTTEEQFNGDHTKIQKIYTVTTTHRS